MLTFVIPAFNEADHIGRCLRSIADYLPDGTSSEVIVVDNGSHDHTAKIAVDAGAVVLQSHADTIGRVRNEGVAASRGDMLVFLDADCALTPEWEAEIPAVLRELASRPLSCAGSQVTPPAGHDVFLWKRWYVPYFERASTLGSAHMICSRETFDEVGGFDETLETGEDYEFCVRIVAGGGSIMDLPSLRVEHYGFPRTWRGFFRRERWHGRGDTKSLRAFFTSKVALTSTTFVACILLSGVALALGQRLAAALAASVAVLLLGGAAVIRFRHSPLPTRAASLLIFPVYFLARTLSVVDSVIGRGRQDRSETTERRREDFARAQDQ